MLKIVWPLKFIEAPSFSLLKFFQNIWPFSGFHDYILICWFDRWTFGARQPHFNLFLTDSLQKLITNTVLMKLLINQQETVNSYAGAGISCWFRLYFSESFLWLLGSDCLGLALSGFLSFPFISFKITPAAKQLPTPRDFLFFLVLQ